MANFILIRDDDPLRRRRAALRAQSCVAFLPHLRAEVALAPDYALAWSAAPGAPVGHHVSAAVGGTDCILFGEPHRDSGERVNASELSLRQDVAWDAPHHLNGYYAAVMIHPWLGVRVEADVVGVFPIYYWQGDGVLLVATSPELFRCHPAFEREIDLHGVAALLLTSGLVSGRTLWRGVRRLGADHILLCANAGAPREVAPPPLEPEPSVKHLDEAVLQASSLHVSFLLSALKSSVQPGLLLSGGLDSRLLAGLATTLGLRPNCVTFGRHDDLDARCATQVAEALQLPQTLCDVAADDYAGYAGSSVRWEQLSGGLYALPMGWNLSMQPPAVPMDRMICGLTLDAVIGGAKHVAPSDQIAFEHLRIGRLGYERARLSALIAAPELARACDDVRDELIQQHLGADRADHLREWRMNLAHRHRFAVGTCAWRYSFFAWPVMPALDRRLLRLAARLPNAITRHRQVQTRMLVTRFPRLARLELDRNYLDTAPLVAASSSVFSEVRRRVLKFHHRCRAWLGSDPRFYVRTMEFNGAGWQVVRALAEEARGAASTLFHPEILDRLIPRPGIRVRRIVDPIIHSTPLKNTLGLLLWLRQQT